MRNNRVIGMATVLAACGLAAASALPTVAAGDEYSRTSVTTPAGEPAALRERPTSAGPQATSYANPLEDIPLRLLTVTRERPLFSPTRRPPPAPVAVVAAPPTPLPPTPQRVAPDRPPLSLIGTISGSPDGIGVFIEETTSRSIRIKTSQAYAGWTLVAVTRREATFQIGDRQATLTFPLPGQDRPRPAPPPAQAASDAQGAQQALVDAPPPLVAVPAWLRADDVQFAPPASAQPSSSSSTEFELARPPGPAGAPARERLKR